MKSVSVKGSFHQQLYSTNKRQPSERTSVKPPLLFKGSNSSRYVPTCSGFSSLLEVDKDSLGPVDPQWFEKAASNGGNCGKDLQCKELLEESLQGVAHQFSKTFSGNGETPTRHRKSSDEVDLGTPCHLHSPPSLFTPDERHNVGQNSRGTSHHPLRDDISPAMPSLVPITPNLPVEESDALRQTQSPLGASPFSVERGAHQDTSPCWNPTHKQTTPTFMKQLFKTPSSLMKFDDFSFTTPGQYLSTPVRMSVSLGADLNESNLSWTSSLATPQGATDTKMSNSSLLHKDWNEESTVVAKALFTSCIETPNCHTPSRGRIDQDSQASNVHLQSLHMSSAEEDSLGDTLGSDVADGEEAGQVRNVDGEVQGGITRCGDLGEEGQCHSDCMSEQKDQDGRRFSTEMQRRTEDEKQNLKKVLVQATAGEDDDDDARTVRICSSAVQTQQLSNHPTDDHSESQTKLTSDQPKQSSHSVQTGSQQSTADLLDNSPSPNVSGLSGVEKSRLDDTLAFFFLTPPQTRSRIANLKKQKQVKETEESTRKTCLSECGDSTAKIQEGRPLQNCCFPKIPSASALGESSPELSEKEKRTTNRRHTVVRIKEEDGSLKEIIENLSETQVSQSSCKNTNLDSEGECGNYPVVSEEETKMTLDDGINVPRAEILASENLNASLELELKHSNIINNLPIISAQPNKISTSIKDLQRTDTCNPTSISIDVTNVTSLKRTSKLDTASNIESPDIFSQISPNFVDALCNLTDQVSESNHRREVSSPASNPPQQVSMYQGNSPSSTTKPDSCILPSAPTKNSLRESVPQPSVPNVTLAKTSGLDLKPKMRDSENDLNVKQKDTQNQLFRMQPKATSTRRFFYPPGSSNAGQAGGRKAMQWMSEAVLVKSDKDKQENSEPGPNADIEKATVETRNSSHSYSSTPSLRNSGFVTFNNFINSKRAQAPSFMYPSKVTVLHHKNVQCQDKLIQRGQSNHQETDRSNVNGQSGSFNSMDQTTPRSRRGSLPQNSSRIRRRADTHDLPAPKRLKTTLENEHQQCSFRCSDRKGTLKMKEPLEEILEDKTSHTQLSGNCTPVEQTPIIGSNSDENIFILKGATSAEDSGYQQLPKNFALSTDIQRKTEEKDVQKPVHFSLSTNKLAADDCTEYVNHKNLKTASTIPVPVGFSSASGNVIHISESALHKARALFEEDKEKQSSTIRVAKDSLKPTPNNQNAYSESDNDVQSNAIPVNVGFTSASGNSIQISESALNKAKTLLTEDNPRNPISSSDSASRSRGAVPNKILGFSSASGKSIQISASALNKAKTLFTEEDPRNLISSSDSASRSRGAVPKTLGFSSASGKAIQISESALQKARLFLEDNDQEPASRFASRSGQNVPRSESGIMKSTMLNKVNDKELLTTQNIVIREHDLNSETDQLNTRANNEAEVPSKVGFASASGKPICVSKTALKRAKQLLEKDENEIPTTVTFASASGKSIEISDVGLKKARAMFEDSGDVILPASSKRSCPDTLTLQNELLRPSKQSGFGQGDSRPQTNYRNLPKGFRPFKAPAKMNTPAKPKTLLKQFHCLPETCDKAKTVPSVCSSLNLKSIPEAQELDFTTKGPGSDAGVKTQDLEFEEFLTASQAQQEIEAAEEMESAYAFMQAEDESFSQFEDLPVGKFILGMGPGRPLTETAVVASQNVQNQECSKPPTNEVFDEKEPVHELLSSVQVSSSQTLSQGSDSFNQAFVQSQLSTGDVTEGQVTIPISFSQQEDSKREIHKILPTSDMFLSADDKMEIPGSNNLSSLNTEKPTFIGFQTAKGNRVDIPQDALQKAKAFLDASSKYEDNEQSLVMKANHRAITHHTDQTQDQKEPFYNGSNSCVFQTAGGRCVEISEEALKKANNLFSEEEKIHSPQSPQNGPPAQSFNSVNQDVRAPEGVRITKSLSKFSDGFQTASGKKVSISEESLERARHVLEGDDVSFRKEQKLPSIATTASDESHQQRKVKAASCGGNTNSQGSVPVGDELYDASSENASPTPGACVGFQTASGNKVTVSAEALLKAHRLLKADEAEMIPRTDKMPICRRKSRKGKRSHEVPVPFPKSALKVSGGFQAVSGNGVTVSVDSLAKAQQFLADKDKPNTNPQTRRSKAFISQEEDSVPTARTSNQAPAPYAGFQTAGGNKVTISAESLAKAQRLLAEGDDDLNIAPQMCETGQVSSHNEDDVHLGPLHSLQHFPTTSVGFQTASGNKVTISAESLAKAQRFLANGDGEQLNTVASQKGENTGLVQISNRSPKACVGFQTAKGNKVTISAESLATAQRFLADDDRTLTHATPLEPCLGFSTASDNKVSVSADALATAQRFLADGNETVTAPKTISPCLGFSTASGNKVSVSADALATAQRFLADGNETVTAPKTTSPCLGFSTASGNKVSVSADALATAQRFLADGNETVTAPKTTQPCLGFSTASGNKVSVSEAALKKAQNLFQDDGENISHVFRHDISSATNQRISNQAPRMSIPLGFQTASGSSVSVSRTSLQHAKAVLGDDVPVSGVQYRGVSRQHPSQGEGTSPLALVPESDSSAVHPPETLAKSRPSFSKKNVQGLRRNDRHHGGECNDAVVPNCGANTTSTSGSLFNAAKDRPLKGILQERALPSKPSTSTTHLRPRSNLNSHQLNSKSTEPSDNSQVVPQTVVPLACQQHRIDIGARSFSSNLSNRHGEVVTNKRGYDAVGGDANSNGLTPKRAKVEVDMKGDSSSERRNAVLSSIEQDIGLPPKEWEEARRSQASRIHGKKTQVIKALPGELMSKKQQGQRQPLYELVHGQSPEMYSESELLSCGVLPSTMTVTSATAEDFKFILKEHFTPDTLESSEGLRLADGGKLVPDETGMAGKQEFLNALLDTPGVDPKFLTPDWVNNHYRWITWKLAAMEMAYPHYLSQRLLTPHQVLLQLKYRYDREIDHAQRSALKKILERDDTPSRRMVLCVAGIPRPDASANAKSHQGTTGKENEKIAVSSTPILLLTDGWYAIQTLIDKPLAGLVNAGKIFVGLKLCIYGAELVGSQDACSPLEVSGNLMLRISANSTRRARYDALLGFQRYPQPFPISLTSLYADGGMVGCVDVVVVRSYPMQYMEKQNEGGCIFRGMRAEDKEAARFAQEKQRRMEKLYSKIQNDYLEKDKKTVKSNRRSMSTQKLTVKEVEKLHSGQEVYEALNNALDPGAVEALLSARQVNVLHDYQRSLHEKRQFDLQGEFKRAMEEQKQDCPVERNVTPLLRLRVVDALRRHSAGDGGTHQLTVWRPSDDVIQLLTEGKCFRIFNVSTSSGRFSVGSNNVQLASTRGTRYQSMPLQSPHSGHQAVYHQRESLRFTDALRPGFTPAYGEVDVVGVVVLIQGAGNSPSKSTSQIVYLCDAQADLIVIRFWGGLQAHCVDNLIKAGCFLAVGNLQWRPNSGSSSIPCLHANDAVVVTTIPKASHLRSAMQHLQKTIKNPKAFAQSIEQSVKDKIATQSRYPTPQTPRSGGVQAPSATPCSAQGATPWAIHRVTPLSDHGPNRSTVTPQGTPVRSHTFDMEGCVSHRQNTTPVLPSANQFPSWSGAHQGSLPRPHAASTPLHSVHSINTTPMRGRPMTHPLPSPYGQTSFTDPLEKSRLNLSRKVDLLSRVPSPPPLSPLPTPPTNRVMSNFRAPSARTSLPQQGSSFRSRANSVLRGQGAKLYPKPRSWQAENDQSEEARCIDFDEQQSVRDTELISPVRKATKPHPAGLDCSAIEVSGRISSDRSSEDMTPSQQQVLEVLGMSYKSLGEIDWEWTQEVDPHSEPSQDFSFDTPSQSSPAEEGLLDAKVVDTNRTQPKTEVDGLKETICVLQVPAIGEDPQVNGKEKEVESTSVKIRRGMFRRGKSGKRSISTYGPCKNSWKNPKVITAKEKDIVDGRGDCLKNASLYSNIADTAVKQNGDAELNSSKNLNHKSVEEMEDVGEGGDCLKTESQTFQGIKLREVEVGSSDNNSCKGTREVAAKEKKVDKRSEGSWSKKELELRQGSKKYLEDSDQDPRRVSASGEHPPQSTPPGQKRRERSRVDLSILEQSSLLGDESGEPTRRLTRSASRRTAAKGGCKN